MTGPGAPRRGRHASPEDEVALPPTSWRPAPSRGPDDEAHARWDAGTTSWDRSEDEPNWVTPDRADRSWAGYVRPGPLGVRTSERGMAGGSLRAGGLPPVPRPAAGLHEPREGETGPVSPPEWRHRPGGDEDTDRQPQLPAEPDRPRPPAAPGPATTGTSGTPLPPLPSGAWSRLRPRTDGPADDDATVGPAEDTVAADPVPDWDRTGGLDVIGAHVDDRDGAADTDVHEAYGDEHADDHHLDLHDDEDDGDRHPALLDDEDIPDAAVDRRRQRSRRRRRSIAVLVSLVVMAALVAGVVLGGRKVLDLVNPPDYTGAGTGSVKIRVQQGDSLKAIGQTMVDGGVIASVRPFTDAAGKEPRATSVSPGIYGLRKHMSSRSALTLLLDPKSRLVSRVTIPEGLTAATTLQRLAQGTGTPVEPLQAAAADTAALGLPAYANGKLEGFLYPATYDFEPGTAPADMLKAMVARGEQVLDELAIPQQDRLTDLTLASIVQAESASAEDMAKVARVLDNRLAQGMPLQLDTTVNYANGKTGLTTTAQDRANASPYNTYVHAGLPPGPISNPGEQALRAVLTPAQGDWLFFVVVNPDTGETRFATTAEEHAKNVAVFQQWLKDHPGR